MKGAVVKIADKEIDFRKVLPPTLGDLEDLEMAGVDLANLSKMKMMVDFVTYFAQKVEPSISRDDVRKLSPAVIKPLTDLLGKVDEDFLS